MKYKDYLRDIEFFKITKAGFYTDKRDKQRYRLKDACKMCGDKFLAQRKSKAIYCSKSCKALDECRRVYPTFFKRGKEHPGYGKQRPDASKRMKENNPTKCGELNPNWRGGKATSLKKLRRVAKFKHWKEAVYKRDGYKCRHCGISREEAGYLHAHHIIPVIVNPDLVYSIDNGETNCSECHYTRYHRKNK